jgi:hypothetical protein
MTRAELAEKILDIKREKASKRDRGANDHSHGLHPTKRRKLARVLA